MYAKDLTLMGGFFFLRVCNNNPVLFRSLHVSTSAPPPALLGKNCTSEIRIVFRRWLPTHVTRFSFVLYAEWRNFVSVDMTKVVERLFRVD